MASKEELDHETPKFIKKELSERNRKLSFVIFFSIVSVAAGIANVILFSDVTNQRNKPSCDFLKVNDLDINISLAWASSGIFAALAIIVASIAKSSTDAWSCQTTAFIVLAPFVVIICLAIVGASGLLGACHTQHYVKISNGQSIQQNISNNPKMFYALIDLVVLVMSFIIFSLLLSAWVQAMSKRNKSKEKKKREEEDKLKKDENKNVPPSTDENTKADKSAAENTPKAVPNVYFIQVPNQPAPNIQADPVSPHPNSMYPNPSYNNPLYQTYGNSPYTPYVNSPYGMPQYRPILPPLPPLRIQQPRRRPWHRLYGGRGYAPKVNRGFSMSPYYMNN